MLDMGRDFYCAYRGVYVAESEFNSDKACYHEPKKGAPYMAAPWGKCKCIECPMKTKEKCASCDNPKRLKSEHKQKTIETIDAFGNIIGKMSNLESRCSQCMAQYKIRGKMR